MNGNKRKQCQKIRYKDKISAMFALSQCRRKIGKVTEKLEVRCYYCDNCHGWHLTSKKRNRKGLINYTNNLMKKIKKNGSAYSYIMS